MLRTRTRSDDFVRLIAAAAAATALSLLSPQLAAAAGARDETLIIVTEEGPSTLDIDAATANVETHGVSWNTYDRLITHAKIKQPDGTWSYDYTKFEPELAESWELAAGRQVGDLPPAQGREVPRRHAGHGQGREMVVRPRRRGRRLPGDPDGRQRNEVGRPVRRRRRPHHPRRLPAAEQADPAQPRRADRQGGQLRRSPRSTSPTRTRGRSNGSASTTPAAAPTWSRAGSRGTRSSSSASTTGSRAPSPISRR